MAFSYKKNWNYFFTYQLVTTKDEPTYGPKGPMPPNIP